MDRGASLRAHAAPGRVRDVLLGLTAIATATAPGGAPLDILFGSDTIFMRRSGVGRVALELARAVRARGDSRLRLLRGAAILPAAALDGIGDDGASAEPAAAMVMAKALARRVPGLLALREAVLHRRLGHAVRRLGVAGLLYHEPNMIVRPFDGPTVAMLHDLSWHGNLRFHPRSRIAWIERNLPRTLRQTTRFACISRFTRDRAMALLGIPAERIDVVHNAPAPIFRPREAAETEALLAPFGLRDRGYVLSVSTLEPRKNFRGLFAAHRLLPPSLRGRFPLVIAGGSGWGAALRGKEVDRALSAGELRLLGHISDTALAALYSRAACFAFVSHYEGFGLPVVEAMASGTPVICSDTTATAEVGGEAARLVPPDEPEVITAALRAVLEDAALAASLTRRGLSRAAEFTWARSAEGMVACWRRALGAFG